MELVNENPVRQTYPHDGKATDSSQGNHSELPQEQDKVSDAVDGGYT